MMKAKNKEANTVQDAAAPASCKVTHTKEWPLAALCKALHGEALRSAARGLHERELLAFLSDESVSRAARIASVMALDDAVLLVVAASAQVPLFVRRNALQRLDEVRNGNPLGDGMCRLLIPCLNEKELVAYAVVLMDESGYDWCAHGTEDLASVLCEALNDCTSIHEAVLLEDACAQLAHRRPDMRNDLHTRAPRSFTPCAVYAPMFPCGSLLVDSVA